MRLTWRWNLISVILSTYNQENTVLETIDSILQQTYKDFEIIAVNNSSTDNTLEELNKVEDNRLSIYTIEYTGLSKARNFGASKASGDYLLFIDGDDKIAPEFLEKSLYVLEDDPNLGFVYTDTQHFGYANTYWEQPEFDVLRLLYTNYICSCSLMRTVAYRLSGGYNEKNWAYWEDYEFWLRMVSNGWLGKHIPEKLFYYRIHAKSGTQSERNTRLALVYKSFIISQFPELYNDEIWNISVNILSLYPENFMEYTFAEQEAYLKEIGAM